MPQRVIESLDEMQALAGQEIGLSDWIEVTQPMIDAFAETTRDRQWIHTDRERAAAEIPRDTGTIIVTFFDGVGGVLKELTARAANTSERWEFCGEALTF